MISKRQRDNAARYKILTSKERPDLFVATDGKKEYHIKKLDPKRFGMLKFWCDCGLNAIHPDKLCAHALAVINSRK